jgi:hypothetical protein
MKILMALVTFISLTAAADEQFRLAGRRLNGGS